MEPALIPAFHDALVVARSGSLALAAERLNKTPSAVSQQLRRLAGHFGAPLFERRGRGVALTALGREALPALTTLFDQAESLFSLIGRLSDTGVSLLRIAASDYIGRALLVPVLRRLAARGAPVHFEIATVHSEEALRRLGLGEVDLAVVTTPAEPDGFAARTLFEQSFFWVMPRRGPRLASLDARLLRGPVLRLAPGSVGRKLLDRYLQEHALRPASTIDVPSVSLLLAYASGGVGIGLVPALACRGLPAGRVSLKRAEMAPHAVRLVTRPRWRGGATAERFVGELWLEAERQAGGLLKAPRRASG